SWRGASGFHPSGQNARAATGTSLPTTGGSLPGLSAGGSLLNFTAPSNASTSTASSGRVSTGWSLPRGTSRQWTVIVLASSSRSTRNTCTAYSALGGPPP